MDQAARAGGQEQELILRATFIATITAAAMMAAAPAFAGDAGEPDQPCGVSTPEMVDCLAAKTAYWDKRLNAAYQAVLKIAGTKQRDQLRLAQRLWLQYRDANCLYYDLGEGSIARIDAGECMRSMTEIRAKELERQK
jgi:uncharacterized protein YecT (DUF1311 family)